MIVVKQALDVITAKYVVVIAVIIVDIIYVNKIFYHYWLVANSTSCRCYEWSCKPKSIFVIIINVHGIGIHIFVKYY